MQISVTGRHMSVGDSLKAHSTERMNGVAEKYFGNPIEAHIVFDKEGNSFKTDIQVHVGRGIKVQGQASAPDAYAAFDTALDRVETRLRRYKNRLKDDKHASSKAELADLVAQQYVLAGEEHDKTKEEAPDQPLVIAEMTTRIDSLTVSEAVMRLDLSGYPVVIFRNRSHGGINVIYRRPDGNIGWVDPQASSVVAA